MQVINTGMRKGIKTMCYTAQTLQFLALMPKPQDFITRIVGDVVYLSSRLNKLSDDMNRLLDSYAEIPGNYLMTQVNSITGSLVGITNRLSTYSQNAVSQTIGLGENTVNTITELTGGVIDTTSELTGAVVNLGSAIVQTGSNVLGQTDYATDVYEATEVILEWTSDGFKNVKSDTTEPLNKVTQKLVDTRTGINEKIESKANAVNDKIEDAQKWVETLILELREKMHNLSDTLDSSFKDVTGLSSISDGADDIVNAIKESGNDSKAAQVTSALAISISEVIKNFSIGKMVRAFTGVLTQSVIVRIGLDKLPPIDFESMLCKIRDDATMSTKELYKHYNDLTDRTYKDLIEFGEESAKIPSDERYYSSKNYDEFVSEFEEEIKRKRDEIRLMMKNAKNVDRSLVDIETNKEIKSAIKEIDTYRKKIKNAKEATTLKSTIGDELNNFKKEVEYRCNSIKADWQSMMKQYKDALKEIKGFFTNGGSCDMFIDDCCDAINKNFDDIKSLCKGLSTQLIGSTIKVAMPADIGTVVPNPVYKIADFIMDIKTILKFIKDLITLIIGIINNINKIARIMLNGINSLKDIIKDFMEILGLKWLMDLVQSIINLFGDNITNTKYRLENTLSPVHFSDTEEYSNTIDALDELLDGGKLNKEAIASLTEVQGLLKTIGENDLANSINGIKSLTSVSDGNAKKIEEFIDELEEMGDSIVAYKSPIIKEVGDVEKNNVSDMVDGGDMDNDIKFIGWHFFHPNLDHTGNTYYKTSGLLNTLLRKIKSKIIKKASKNGHKRGGGINMLKRRTVGTKLLSKRVDKAYTAFYWYTYYTEDLEKDCFEYTTAEKSIVVDNVVKTENGSIVELNDGRKVFVADNTVKSGDYVTVEGIKYKVR